MDALPHADLVAGLTTLREVVEPKPRIVLEIYEFGIILRKPRTDGQTAFAVDPEAIWQALAARTGIESGLILPGTLYFSKDGDRSTVIEYREPQITGIWLEGSENAYRIPMPGLVLIRTLAGKNPHYALFAVKQRPETLDEELFRAPLPHVGHDNGSVCWGTVPTPDEKLMKKSTSLAEDWKLLLGSKFGNHTVSGLSQKYKKDVRSLYAALETDGAADYPPDDLVSTKKTFGGLLERLRQ